MPAYLSRVADYPFDTEDMVIETDFFIKAAYRYHLVIEPQLSQAGFNYTICETGKMDLISPIFSSISLCRLCHWVNRSLPLEGEDIQKISNFGGVIAIGHFSTSRKKWKRTIGATFVNAEKLVASDRGLSYWLYIWNITDFVMVVLFFSYVSCRVLLVSRFISYPELQPQLAGQPEVFMPYSIFRIPLGNSRGYLAIVGLLTWAKIFKYISIMGFFRVLVKVIEMVLYELMVFGCLLDIIFTGLAVAFHTGFASAGDAFSTLQASFFSLLFMLAKAIDLQEVFDYSPGLGAALFILYLMLFYFLLLTVFMAIVLDVVFERVPKKMREEWVYEDKLANKRVGIPEQRPKVNGISGHPVVPLNENFHEQIVQAGRTHAARAAAIKTLLWQLTREMSDERKKQLPKQYIDFYCQD